MPRLLLWRWVYCPCSILKTSGTVVHCAIAIVMLVAKVVKKLDSYVHYALVDVVSEGSGGGFGPISPG